MSEQAVDLRSTWAVVRRRGRVIIIAALVGALVGLGLLFAFPPPYTSASVVLLPAATQAGTGKSGGYADETQVIIATSSEILGRAAQQVIPKLSQTEIKDRVTVEAPAPAVIRIEASGPTGNQAEFLASAVAQSLVEYLEKSSRTIGAAQQAALQARLDTLEASLDEVNTEIAKASKRLASESRSSAAGRADAAALSELTAVRASTVLEIDAVKKQLAGDDTSGGQVLAGASVIQRASPGEQPGMLTALLTYVVGGAAALGLLAFLYLVVTNQRDPKLRSRDEIADAVGIPVVASLRTRAPRTAAAWVERLRTYEPNSADGWAMRQLLRGLVPEGTGKRGQDGPLVLVVITLSGDTGALAVGPQIATFAASTGLTSQFFAAQLHESATTLWAACSQASQGSLPEGLTVTTVPDSPDELSLSVRLVVLDRDAPAPDPEVIEGGVGLFAVSSAAVTRRNLADAAVAADRAGLLVQGIVVSNPDPLDRTTGRLSPLERAGSLASLPTALPNRQTGSGTATGGARAPAGGQRRRANKGRKSR